jgi:uncharacterized membrane protein
MKKALLVLTFTCILTCIAANVYAVGYTIKNLGIASGFSSSSAVAINSRGEVAVNCTVPAKDGPPRCRAFVWKDGKLQDLGLPPGCEDVGAIDINDKGEVLVYGESAGTSFIWIVGKWKKIGLKDTTPIAINNAGQVALMTWDAGYLWQNGRTQKLKMLPKWDHITLYDMNNKGQVLGMGVILSEYNEQAYNAIWEGGKVKLIKPQGAALNDRGQIAGRITEKDREYGAVWSNGQKQVLYPPKGFYASRVVSLNNKGVAAGQITDNAAVPNACVWLNGAPKNLGTLGGSESSARKINDIGMVCGWAEDKQCRSHAVIWVPAK